LFKLFKNKVKV